MPSGGGRWVMSGRRATALLAGVAGRSMHLPDEPATTRSRVRDLASPPTAKRLFLAWMLGVFKLGTYWTCYTCLPTFLIRDMDQGLRRSLALAVTAQVGQFPGLLSVGARPDRVCRR